MCGWEGEGVGNPPTHFLIPNHSPPTCTTRAEIGKGMVTPVSGPKAWK